MKDEPATGALVGLVAVEYTEDECKELFV